MVGNEVMARPRHARPRIPLLLALVVLTVVGIVSAQRLQTHRPYRSRLAGLVNKPPPAPSPSRATRPTNGRVEVLRLRAPDEPGGVRSVWVYRPGVPDSPALPVVYFLHGLPGSYLDLASIGVRHMLDSAFESGRLAPFVLAAPDGNSRRAWDPEWADATGRGLRLETFVTGRLIAAVEGPYRRNRQHRAIIGFSMGGYGAMNIALRHPGLYSAVASIAGYYDTDDEANIFGGRPALLAANRPDRHVAQGRSLRVMLADGSSDTVPVVAGETRRFARLLRAAGATPVVDIEPGGHNGAYLAAELPRVFAFLDQTFAAG